LQRRRRVFALIVVAAAAVLGIVLLLNSGGGSGSGSGGSRPVLTKQAPSKPAPPVRLRVQTSAQTLPAPLSGETIVQSGGNLLVIGGLDSSDASTASILGLDPVHGKSALVGSLSQPIHDAAAARLPSGVLVFGGGSETTIDEVEHLVTNRTGKVIGHLPVARSDLSAVSIGGEAYVLGGYDGRQPLAQVLATRDGRSFGTVAQLPVPVRYAAVVPYGRTIFVLGGELATDADSSVIQAVNLATGSASVVGRLPDPLAHASTVDLGGRIYILGGRLAGSTTDQILRFDPLHVRVVRAGRLPTPVQNAAAATIGGVGYLVGGLNAQGAALSAVFVLRLDRPD
jgi:N-acetylneuraminic acid mutarotase